MNDVNQIKYIHPGGGGTSDRQLSRGLCAELDQMPDFNEMEAKLNGGMKYEPLYIPSLRGLRRFDEKLDIYEERTREDYFKSTEIEKLSVFSGLKFYYELRDQLLGDAIQRRTISEFQQFLSKSFFDDEEVTLIPKVGEEVVWVKIGDEEERRIHEYGDGIQMIIILTFRLYCYRCSNYLVFIEEPEIYLHPGMQRILLNTLMDGHFNNHQYFITTHSNHFLDMTIDYSDIAVFTFEKEFHKERTGQPTFKVERIVSESHNALQLLGVRNSSVLLTNCTVWVEGVTDRRYFRHYLKLYQDQKSFDGPKFQEDLHYSFVEYSGGNITHWSFLDEEGPNVERLCGKLMLIADQDGVTDDTAKAERQAKLTEKLKDQFVLLQCRELENLVSEKVLMDAIRHRENEHPEGKVPKINFPKFSWNDYKDSKLAQYITEVLLTNVEGAPYKYMYGKSTDLYKKTDFCDHVIASTDSYDDLSDEAKRITELIYKHIKDHNS